MPNVDDLIWALDGDSVRLVCRHSRASIGQWFRRWPNGTETQVAPDLSSTTRNVGSVLTLTMSQSLNGSSYRCRLFDLTPAEVFASGQNSLLLGGSTVLMSLICCHSLFPQTRSK